MLNEIKELINKLMEYTKEKSPILINPSIPEIKKLLRDAYKDSKIHNGVAWGRPNVRFLVSKKGYFFANSNDWVHSQMAKEMNVHLFECLLGELGVKGTVTFYKFSLFDYLDYSDPNRTFMDEEEIINMFKQTEFYPIISSMVSHIEVEK